MAIYTYAEGEMLLNKQEQFKIAQGADVSARIRLAKSQNLSIRVSEILTQDPVEKVRIVLAEHTPLLYIYNTLIRDRSRDVRYAAMNNPRFCEH